MGQKNNVMCNYLSEPAVFADFVNGSIHKGKTVILPHQLSARKTVYYQKENRRPSDNNTARYIERRRDTLKTVCNNNCYIVIGIETQDNVNHIIPLRCMEYDVNEYKDQLAELNRNRTKKLSGNEFLSGRAKDEKLIPVTTIVFYHGEAPYDGCTSLHDMLEWNKGNKAYKHLAADYHVNLVRVEDLDETLFQTGLRELVGFLKRRNDKKGLMDFMEQDNERIKKMDEKTLDAVSIMLNIPASVTRQKEEENEEDYDLCKALREWAEDERNAGLKAGREEGRKKGREEGRKKGREEGENRFASLASALISADRLNDLERAAKDEIFRNSLYQEYAL